MEETLQINQRVGAKEKAEKGISALGAFALVLFGWIAILFILFMKYMSNNMVRHPVHAGREELSFGKGMAAGFDTGFWESPAVQSLNDNCFYPGTWSIKGGNLSLSVVPGPSFCEGMRHSFNADLVATRERFVPPFTAIAKMKVASGPGIVSAFFTYTDPLDGNPHFENDVEIVGPDDTRKNIWLNLYNPNTDPAIGNHRYLPLPFDAAEEFVEYTIEVGLHKTVWKVNGEVLREENYPGLQVPPQRVLFNSWFAHEWITIFDKTEYDHVKTPLEVESVRIIPGAPL